MRRMARPDAAGAKMQADMQKAQEKWRGAEVQGEAGAGLVKVIMTIIMTSSGWPSTMPCSAKDKEVLEDCLLAAAVNDAVRKVEAHNRGPCPAWPLVLNPGGFKLPF